VPHATPRAKHHIQFDIAPPPPAPGAPAPAPGAPPPAPIPIAAGVWTITLTETAGTATDVDGWMESTHVWITQQIQPTFVGNGLDRSRTLCVPATAANVVTVASYDYRDNTLAGSSSRGPTLDTSTFATNKPDITGPGVGIFSVKAASANTGCWCDCCYDFYVSKDGTSMAAPHVTGIVALMFGKDKTLTYLDVRTALLTHPRPPDPSMGTLPDPQWGVGIVDAHAVLGAVVARVFVGSGATASAGEWRTPGELPGRLAPVIRLTDGADWPATVPTAHRIAALRCQVAQLPSGQLVAALVSTHVDEIRRLVNTERRVLVGWHRMRGPRLLREAMRFADGRPMNLPDPDEAATVGHLARLLDLFREHGSPALRGDVELHGPVVLALARDLLASAHPPRSEQHRPEQPGPDQHGSDQHGPDQHRFDQHRPDQLRKAV
jgi:hypothetical protein